MKGDDMNKDGKPRFQWVWLGIIGIFIALVDAVGASNQNGAAVVAIIGFAVVCFSAYMFWK